MLAVFHVTLSGLMRGTRLIYWTQRRGQAEPGVAASNYFRVGIDELKKSRADFALLLPVYIFSARRNGVR